VNDTELFSVLVLCTGNSARSQIAEALFTIRSAHREAGRLRVASAGSQPAEQVNPYAIAVLREHGIPWDDRLPVPIDAVAAQQWDLVLTVCDNARDACPVLPRAVAQVHWGLPDPASQTDDVAAKRAFLWTYHALLFRVNTLLALPLELMDPPLLIQSAERIHAVATARENTTAE
jgi:arsenate reductase (thioredoxin)